MAWRPKVKIDKNTAVAFSNWLSQLTAMIMARFAYLILGRASAKTTEIIAKRVVEMAYDIPGAPIVWVSDTYSNLQKNILNSVLEGLEREGFREGIHYVIGKEPPKYTEAEKEDLSEEIREHFWKPYNKLVSYNHTMIFFTGLNITFGSLDRPSSLAGRSYVHVIGDEVKYFPEHKIANLLKAVRGFYVKYGHSVFYRGHTFTTDMPNTRNIGEHDWILKQANKMKKSGIMRILKVAFVLNQCIQERLYFQQKGDLEETAKKLRTEQRWYERWKAARMHKDGHTFFFVASSLVNIDILTPEWFTDAIETDMGDLDTAILSLKPTLESGERFYANLAEKHFYDDGIDPVWGERFGINDVADCRELRYLDRKKSFDIGVDFGNMMSMSIGQLKPQNKYRILKFMFTLSPRWIYDLGNDFKTYFAKQEEKTVNMYYDRSGNNLRKAGVDYASQLKEAIEYDWELDDKGRPIRKGKRTGWRVNLMSLNQGNITQAEEYGFMQELLLGTNSRLPDLLIDRYQAKHLKASYENARIKIVVKKDGASVYTKDKSSEKLPIAQLPLESTNPSDSGKYLLMRREWRNIYRTRSTSSLADPSPVR